MASEEELVRQANEAFYRAFESLDMKRMEEVWAKAVHIECGHPGWRVLRGWDAVMESWKRIFENTPAIQFMLTDISIQVHDTLAWVTLYENLNSKVEGQDVSATILTTNIFQKAADGWRMIHHHGSSVAQPASQDHSTTVH
ncbi:MAG TPA: nuclear transport factor 2 family protein [Candidatus Binatia bacterium]